MYNIFTEGHALSKKLINQVKKTDKKIKQLLLEYSSLQEQLSDKGKTSFHELTFDSAKQQGTFNVDESIPETNCIPSSIRRHAIEMLHLHKRSKEEKVVKQRDEKSI